MSKENLNAIASLSPAKQIDFANRLIGGEDGVEYDLSVGMAVMKRIASEGNPKAQFFLYLHYARRNQYSRGVEWLKKAYAQDYEPAFLASIYSCIFGTMKWRDKTAAYRWLRQKSETDPNACAMLSEMVGHGHAPEENQIGPRAWQERAERLGFDEQPFQNALGLVQDASTLKFTKVTPETLRGYFQRSVLPHFVFEDFDLLIDALNDGADSLQRLFQRLWEENVCAALDCELQENPLSISFTFDELSEDNAEDRLFLLTATMNRMHGHVANHFAIVFGDQYAPRLFLAELSPPMLPYPEFEPLFVCEYTVEEHIEYDETNYSLAHKNYGLLSMMEDPLLSPAEEKDRFIERTLAICAGEE